MLGLLRTQAVRPAALLGGSGKVWAFDMDAARLARLQANAAIAGAGNVVATQADFLQVDVTDERYAQVRCAICKLLRRFQTFA